MKSVGSLASEFWESIELDKASRRALVLEKWNTITDQRLREMCFLKGFSRATVLLLARNPAAAMELRYTKNKVLQLLNESAGEDLFDSVRVIQRPLRANER